MTDAELVQQQMTPPIPKTRNPDAEHLKNWMLKRLQAGEVEITYAEMDDEMGCHDIQKKYGSWIQSAVRWLLQDDRIVLICERSRGYRRARNDELAGVGGEMLRHVKRTTRKARRKMATVDYQSLDDQQRHDHDRVATQLAITQLCTEKRATKLIDTAVEERRSQLPSPETFRLLSGNGKK